MRYSKLAELGQINSVGKMTEGLARWIATLRKMDYEEILNVLYNKTVADINFFHGRTVAALIAQNFFDGDTGGEFTNMPQFIRPTNEFALILGMRLSEGANANVEQTVWTPGLATVIKNGTFNFTVNGVIYRSNYPLLASIAAAEDIDQGIIQFDQPILIGDQEPFKIDVAFETAPVATTNLLIELIGIGTIS